MRGSDDQFIKFYEGSLARRYPEMSSEDRRIEAGRLLSDPESGPRIPANFSKFTEMYYGTVPASASVLCMSEVRDDLLMWAHYADSHKGVCLALTRSNPFFATAHPVNYQDLRPEVNWLTDSREIVLDRTMFTKSDHWRHEKEWRILRYEHRHGPSPYTLPSEVLAGIVLGSQISEEHRIKITEWAAGSHSKPWIHKAALSPTEFKLVITP